jgi:hypothetical protein
MGLAQRVGEAGKKEKWIKGLICRFRIERKKSVPKN